MTVVLGASQEASFDITLNDNSFTRKWVEELRWCLSHCEFNQHESFALLNSLSDASDILQQSCLTINRYIKNFIDIRPNMLEQPQDYLNYLHGKFEALSGEFDKPTKLFQIANQELKDAIRNLNYYVHVIESKGQPMPGLYISFDKDQYRRQQLSEDDYEFFEFKFPSGTLFLHYAELGKEFIDLYEDNLPLDYPGFKNLHYYSGEASITFLPYDAFADEKYRLWLQTNDIDMYNKKLGHGKIPLGKVDNLQDAISNIKEHRHIAKILIKE